MKFTISQGWGRRLLPVLVALVVGACFLASKSASGPSGMPRSVAGKPALSVRLIAPETVDWPQILPASGNVVAWQEAVIGAEIGNYRISEVLAQVGNPVKKGQVLARIANDTVASELAEATASVAELQASANEARGNSERAAELKAKGFYSTQLNNQYQTAEHMTQARLEAARARLQGAQLKMARTSVLAPDDGIISACSATVGSLTQTGQEMFRLIRGARLEWRAEVQAADLMKIKAGTLVKIIGPNGERISGHVRAIAPSVDPQTRNALVYVDLPGSSALRAGMFARGEFELGHAPALVLPPSAVVLREGFAYVFRQDGENHVAQIKVTPGRQFAQRIEIVGGLDAHSLVVESGAGFLADGDLVKIVAHGGKAQ